MDIDYRTVTELFERACGRFASKKAYGLANGDATHWVTYGELYEMAREWAVRLKAEGIGEGDFVAFQGQAGPEWGAIFFGALWVGAVAVPLDDQLPHEVRLKILGKAQPRAMIARREILDSLVEWAAEANVTLMEFGRPDAPAGVSAPAMHKARPEDLMSVMFTSGTTGGNKGAMISHRNVIFNVEKIVEANVFPAEWRLLTILPVHHIYAFTFCLVYPLHYGTAITFLPTDKLGQLNETLQRDCPHALIGVPRLFAFFSRGIMQEAEKGGGGSYGLFRALLGLSAALYPLLKHRPGRLFFRCVHKRVGGNLEVLFSGGAPLDPAVGKNLSYLGFNMMEGYGLTEAAPLISMNLRERNRLGTVGRPIPDMELRIDAEPGEQIGELVVRGDNVFMGYYQAPKATARVLKDGWLYTGDMAYLDAAGHVVICGRKKDVIVLSSGKKVFPEEVEGLMSKSSLFADCALVETGNDRLGLLVMPDGHLDGRTGKDLEQALRKEMVELGRDLPVYARPRSVHVLEEGLPRTRIGKLQRHKIKLPG